MGWAGSWDLRTCGRARTWAARQSSWRNETFFSLISLMSYFPFLSELCEFYLENKLHLEKVQQLPLLRLAELRSRGCSVTVWGEGQQLCEDLTACSAFLCQWPLCEGTQLADWVVDRVGTGLYRSVYSRDMPRRISSLILETLRLFPHSLSQTATVRHSFVKMLARKTDQFIQRSRRTLEFHMWMIQKSLHWFG